MAVALKLSSSASVRVQAAKLPRAQRVLCLAQKSPVQRVADVCQRAALPAMVAAILVAGAFDSNEALAAKSGGRVGGSSGFSSRRQQSAPTTVNTYSSTTIVAAPPVYASPGFGYGFGGFSFMPTFFMPTFFPFSGLLSLFFFMALISVVFNVIRGVASGSRNNKKDDWGDL